jgi:hypothetical protein
VKLQDYRDDFYTYSGKASDLSRQLAFAGIALIWLFKKESGGQLTIPNELVLPSIFIVVALALDLIHYCLASVIWRIFYRSKEKEGVDEDTMLQHSTALETPIWTVFCAKIAFVLLAYAQLLAFLVRAISFK